MRFFHMQKSCLGPVVKRQVSKIRKGARTNTPLLAMFVSHLTDPFFYSPYY